MNLVNELTNIKVKLYEYNLHSRLYETRSRPKVEILFITKGRNFQNEMSRFSWWQVDIFIMKGRDLSAYNHFRTELSHTFCTPSPCNHHWFLINFIKIYISFQLIFFHEFLTYYLLEYGVYDLWLVEIGWYNILIIFHPLLMKLDANLHLLSLSLNISLQFTMIPKVLTFLRKAPVISYFS